MTLSGQKRDKKRPKRGVFAECTALTTDMMGSPEIYFPVVARVRAADCHLIATSQCFERPRDFFVVSLLELIDLV